MTYKDFCEEENLDPLKMSSYLAFFNHLKNLKQSVITYYKLKEMQGG